VYQAVLGRAPDGAGQAFWLQALQNGLARQAAALGLENSPESLARIVTAAYENVLGRTPDAQGLANWVSALGRGLTPAQLEALLATSTEFLAVRGGVDMIPHRPVPVPVPVDTVIFNPFIGGIVDGGGFTTPVFTGGFTGGGFSGGGFSGGGSGS
jgi:hypothetical protein